MITDLVVKDCWDGSRIVQEGVQACMPEVQATAKGTRFLVGGSRGTGAWAQGMVACQPPTSAAWVRFPAGDLIPAP